MQVMRRVVPVLVSVCLAGCLAAPPDPAGGGGGDDGAGDGAGDGAEQPDAGGASAVCVPGSRLDLAYVDRIGIGSTKLGAVALAGMAVVINPGPDTVLIPSMVAQSPSALYDVTVVFSLAGSEGELQLLPGEAKGALAAAAQAVVGEDFAEAWVDVARPELSGSFQVTAAPPGWGARSVPLELNVGGYSFDLTIELVEDDPASTAATPRSGDRRSAYCE